MITDVRTSKAIARRGLWLVGAVTWTLTGCDGGESGEDSGLSGAMSGGGAGTESSSGDDSEGGTTGEPPQLGICEAYLGCVLDAAPEVIATETSAYGEAGSCWDLPGVEAQDCWTECRAKMAMQREANPEIAACWECAEDSECENPERYCHFSHQCTDMPPILACWGEGDFEGDCLEFPYEGWTQQRIESACDPELRLTTACPDDGLIGRCYNYDVMQLDDLLEVVVAYYEPRWTEETASQDCYDGGGSYFEP